MPNRNGPKYVILGAGISALTLAWFLKKENPRSHITIIEKEKEIGGWIQTDQKEGYLFERGPHSLRLSPPYDKTCLTLFQDLDLSARVIEPNTASNKRYLAFNDQLHPLNFHPLMLLAPQNFFKYSFPLLKGLRQKKDPRLLDEDLASFFRRHFGEYITHNFVDPFVMGIKGGDIEKLSLKSCFPLLEELSQKDKPLLIELIKHLKQNPAKLTSFKGGFADLINAFKEKLDAKFLLKTEVIGLCWHPNPSVITPNQKIECDHIFSTLPASSLASLFKDSPITSMDFLTKQKRISYKMVHLGFNQILDIPKAFGFISPSWSQQKISGAIFDSQIFPSQNSTLNQTRLSVMIHQDSPLFNQTGNTLKESVLMELMILLKIKEDPDYYQSYDLKDAIPQYHVGHEEKLDFFKKEMKRKFPDFTFLGSSFYGLSVPMCIHNAYLEAKSTNLLSMKSTL